MSHQHSSMYKVGQASHHGKPWLQNTANIYTVRKLFGAVECAQTVPPAAISVSRGIASNCHLSPNLFQEHSRSLLSTNCVDCGMVNGARTMSWQKGNGRAKLALNQGLNASLFVSHRPSGVCLLIPSKSDTWAIREEVVDTNSWCVVAADLLTSLNDTKMVYIGVDGADLITVLYGTNIVLVAPLVRVLVVPLSPLLKAVLE